MDRLALEIAPHPATDRRESDLGIVSIGNDPQEETNLVEQHPERVEKMRTALEEWQKSVLGSWSGEDYVKK